MKKLAIAGCGKLGGIVVDAMIKGLLPDYELVGDRKSTRLNSSHANESRMPSSA